MFRRRERVAARGPARGCRHAGAVRHGRPRLR